MLHAPHRIVYSNIRTSILGVAILLALPRSARAQDRDDGSRVTEATRRRDAGDLPGAAELLRPYVRRHPEELEAARLLAQILYWIKDFPGARQLYEETLALHPNDVPLRLQYGRMLLETVDAARLGEVVTPLLDVPAARGQAQALLGTSAYWQGDLSAAKRLLSAALRAGSTQADVRGQLREIAALTAPWVRVASDLRHDDQPLERLGVGADAGWFLTPLTVLTAHPTSSWLRSGDSLAITVSAAVVRLTHYAAGIRTELEAAVGALQRTAGGATDWTGRLGIGVRLPRHFALRARGEREVYLYTLASLTTPVMTSTGTALLAWNHPRGWLGEAAVQRQWYPDKNAISTAYVWVLAPVARGGGSQLQIGYGASAQNADESRFVLASPQQPYPPTDPRFSLDGRYVPYYTPANLVTHSALAAATARLAPSITLRLNGSYAVRATDDKPVLVTSAGPTPGQTVVVRSSNRRTFSPWIGRAALELAPTGALTLAATGEIMRTAFYTAASAGVQVGYRFTGAAVRRVER